MLKEPAPLMVTLGTNSELSTVTEAVPAADVAPMKFTTVNVNSYVPGTR
jgi:hypothetical protein